MPESAPAIDARQVLSTTPAQLAEIMRGPPERFAPWVRAAAECGLVEAQAILGQILLDGTGLPKDPQAGLQWFKRAAHADHLMAINMVGRCYENGWGTEPDQVVAAYWFRLAADRGLDWGMYNYAHMLNSGRGGVASDPAAALALYRRAADMGHAKSHGMVGRFYEEGRAVEPDPEHAFDRYRRSAEGGDFRGMFHYARMLIARGDAEQALDWLRRVPRTSTPAFMQTVRDYACASGFPEIAQWGRTLAVPRPS